MQFSWTEAKAVLRAVQDPLDKKVERNEPLLENVISHSSVPAFHLNFQTHLPEMGMDYLTSELHSCMASLLLT